MKKKFSIALVGATGMVGRELLKVLEKSLLPISEILCMASPNSVGTKIPFQQKSLTVRPLSLKNFEHADIAFLCAGSKISKELAPELQKKYPNLLIIDNSSAFRMDPNIPLIIPEINPHVLKKNKLIASPNCTTTLLLLALAPLHKEFPIKKVFAATYQAASGGGKKLTDRLLDETKEFLDTQTVNNSFPYGFNLYLHNSPLLDNRYSEEEMKMLHESRKILEDPSLQISAMCVRVPILRAHSIATSIEFQNPFSLEKIYQILQNAPGLKIFEDFSNNRFPTPFDATNQYDVFCGRLRQDQTSPQTLELWIVGDQLLKGAALNAVQIAELFATSQNT